MPEWSYVVSTTEEPSDKCTKVNTACQSRKSHFAAIGLTNDSETAKILAPPFLTAERSSNFFKIEVAIALTAIVYWDNTIV